MTSCVDTHSDLTLARGLAAGELSAFEELYRRHQRRVYSLCLRMLGNTTDAEDCTQEVFLQLFRKIRTFRGTAALSTWLYRLTVNTVLMHMRSSHWKHRGEASEADEIERAGALYWTNNEGSKINWIDLDRAIRRLPPGYRAVFLLHDVEGYEHEEIARMLKIAVGTTKSQLHKARLRLREMLAPGHRPTAKRATLEPSASKGVNPARFDPVQAMSGGVCRTGSHFHPNGEVVHRQIRA